MWSVYTFVNCKMCGGVKSGTQETGDVPSPGCLIKSISFPMAAARYRIIRMCLYGAIQEVVMLPPNWDSCNRRVINLCYFWILSQLIMLLIRYHELCPGMDGLFLVSKLARGSSHTAGSYRSQALIFIFQWSHITVLTLDSPDSHKSLLIDLQNTVIRSTVLALLEIGVKSWVPLACLG